MPDLKMAPGSRPGQAKKIQPERVTRKWLPVSLGQGVDHLAFKLSLPCPEFNIRGAGVNVIASGMVD